MATASQSRGLNHMVTKRQLGIVVVVAVLLLMLGIVAVDLFEAGKWGGFGPLQRIGVGLGVAGFAVGAILIRIGDRPA
ncbi:MAG: hypothetical protein E3J64_02395 [Anaerolineales bacterium]|nr:MAG: hypothetical protein E3J64_02395 [Anaerolineales bacterium]